MLKSIFVIVATVAYVTVAHPQLFYPTAFSYQNSFVRNTPQTFMAAENEGMDRFTTAQLKKQTNSPYREDKYEYVPGMDRFTTAQLKKQTNSPYRENKSEYVPDMDRFTTAQLKKQTNVPHREDKGEYVTGMDRFTTAQLEKQTNFPYREDKGEYVPYTAQRYDDRVNRDRIERFE